MINSQQADPFLVTVVSISKGIGDQFSAQVQAAVDADQYIGSSELSVGDRVLSGGCG